MKRIVFCADGTWDQSNDKTNVYTLYKALKTTHDQLPFYDDGVGSDGLAVVRFVGGAFGTGLWKKIKTGYTAIAHVYEPGDQVFLFGFSRGAYTARSLAGMIAAVGLPSANFDDALVERAFDAYRNKADRGRIIASLGRYQLASVDIEMIGVWDTVGALGVPSLVGGVDPLVYGFLDTGLHPSVKHAYHALAIDERRQEFPATLWTSAPAPGQTIEQVWFAGVHCDVGGSYPETGLSDITLSWMMRKAEALGLEFDDAARQRYEAIDARHALDTIHESWKPLWGFPKRRQVPAGASIANTVVLRCAHETTYRPSNVSLVEGAPTGYQVIDAVSVVERT